jgi:transporter family protein
MNYIGWAILAMCTQGISVTLVKYILRSVPPETAVIFTNGILVLSAIVWGLVRGFNITSGLGMNQGTLLIGVAGLLISVSIISYYKALSDGPASTVVPIFAMSLAIAAVAGLILLSEPVKLTRLLGLPMAAGAVFLLTR